VKKTFNWGVIGCGKIAQVFATDVQTIPGADIYAVASRSLEKAERFAQANGTAIAVGSYKALLEIEELDAVYVATPHVFHAENSIMCLNAKIPVLCEKPLAMDARQVRQMIAAAKFNDTFLMEAMWTRFMPPVGKALEIINSGVIGELNSVKADFGFAANFNPEHRLFNPALGGGSLLDIGIYPVFLAILLFGKPQQIDAEAVLGKTGIDNACGILLKFPEEKIAILHSTLMSDTSTEAFIYGSAGYIHIHSSWHKMTNVSLHLHEKDMVQHFEFEKNSQGYNYEAEEAMRCIAEGKLESEAMSHAFSLQLIETLDAIRHKAGINFPEID
jgi:predicted dehydrogenase